MDETSPAGTGDEPEGGSHAEAEGGDPACWLDRVCPECGAFTERGHDRCPRCGSQLPDAEDGA